MGFKELAIAAMIALFIFFTHDNLGKFILEMFGGKPEPQLIDNPSERLPQ